MPVTDAASVAAEPVARALGHRPRDLGADRAVRREDRARTTPSSVAFASFEYETTPPGK